MIEDYLVDSADLGIQNESKCYIPIFVSDPGQRSDVFNAWFLGNMFLDNYFVVHDVENVKVSDDIKVRRFPRIGIYDKKNPQAAKAVDKDDKVIIPTDPSDDTKTGGDSKLPTDEGGLGAGWVIFILLLIFGGLGGIYFFFGD